MKVKIAVTDACIFIDLYDLAHIAAKARSIVKFWK